MDSPLSTFIGRPLEVLYDICYVDFVAVDSCQAQSLIQYFSRRSYERAAGQIFLIPGLFAHEHNRRFRRPVAKHGLRRRFP